MRCLEPRWRGERCAAVLAAAVILSACSHASTPDAADTGAPSRFSSLFSGSAGSAAQAAGGPAFNADDCPTVDIRTGAGTFTVNGKVYPHDREFVLKEGTRYRLVFRNRTDDAHPMHLHRHLFELTEIYGKAIAGIMKDTVVVPFYGRASVDFVANQPGLTLFHCHIQHHMDFGFKALLRYA